MRPRYSSYWMSLGSFALAATLTHSSLAQETPEQAPAPPAEPQPPAAQPPAAEPPGDAPTPQPEQPPPGQAPGQAPAQAAPGQAPAAGQPPAAGAQPAPQQPSAPAPTTGAPPAPAVAPEPAPTPPAPVQPAPPAAQPPPAATAPTSPPTWSGQAASPEDTGVSEGDKEDEGQDKPKSPWRLSLLSLDQSVTTETVGVGQDFQSRNPTYDWTLSLLPRYYFITEDDWSWSALGNFSLAQELTNSDGTTKRRELDAGDSVVSLRYDRTLAKSKEGFVTLLRLQAPDVIVPTSRSSRNNGRVLGLAASVSPIQVLPLSGGEYFSSIALLGLARYQHYFSQAQVPTNDELTRVRTDVDGRPVVADQLSGAAFAKHETRFGLVGELTIHDRVALATVLQWRPTWNYQFDDEDVCVEVLTGCADVDGVESPQRYEVVTVFATEVEAQVMDEMSVTVGYVNQANQIGPDGQRRNMFYSPNARFYLTLSAYLEKIFNRDSTGPASNSLTASNGGSFVW